MISKPKDFIDNKAAEKIINFMDSVIGGGMIERIGRQSSKDMVRFRPVAEVCKKVRESTGMTMKQIATRLKVPQYRLKSIEESNLIYIQVKVLESYIDFLRIKEWFSLWMDKNRNVYNRLKKK